MNWKQTYNTLTPQERIEIALLIAATVDNRKRQLVVARGRLIHERRGPFPGAHFINQRRGRNKWSQAIIPLTFGFTLLTTTTATGLSIFHAPPNFTATALFFYITSIWAVLAFKPRHLKTSYTS